jgi:hypothetical protein
LTAAAPSGRPEDPFRIVATEICGDRLSLTCAGRFGIGSLGNSPGEQLRAAVDEAVVSAPALTDVTIDFTAVEYEWGDGPLSALVGPVLRRRLRVTYLARDAVRASLEGLFASSGVRQFGELKVTEPEDVADSTSPMPATD